MSFYISKKSFKFYVLLFLTVSAVFVFLNQGELRVASVSGGFETEQRVIRCELELAKDLVQNLYYLAPSLQDAKKQLFNAKNGLMFDNELYVKTVDYNGKAHIVKFSEVFCDSVGHQVNVI